MLKLVSPWTWLRAASEMAILNARTRPQPNPTDRYSGLRLGRGARNLARGAGRSQTRTTASPNPTEEGKHMEKKNKTEKCK